MVYLPGKRLPFLRHSLPLWTSSFLRTIDDDNDDDHSSFLSLTMIFYSTEGGELVSGMAKEIEKEDQYNERIVRGLLKLPENSCCINCESLGPRYVCIDFWTFVCIICSGVHREFSHRVKSVSVSKFTSHEVSALQEGGNKRAKEFYLREWDPQNQSFPNSRNIEILRDFIRQVYVDRRYIGEKSGISLRVKMVGKEDWNACGSGSRGPPGEDTYGNCYDERYGPGERNEERNSRYGYEESGSRDYDIATEKHGHHKIRSLKVLRDILWLGRPRSRKSEGRPISEEGHKLDGISSDDHKGSCEGTYQCRYGERYGPSEKNDERNSRYGYDESRSPRYYQPPEKHGQHRRSHSQNMVFSDKISVGRSRSRESEGSPTSEGEHKVEGRYKWPHEDIYASRYERHGLGEKNDVRNSRDGYDESRSRGYDLTTEKHGHPRRSHSQNKVFCDKIWFGRSRSRKSEVSPISEGEHKLEGTTNDHKGLSLASMPVTCPVWESVADDPPTLSRSESSCSTGSLSKSAAEISRRKLDFSVIAQRKIEVNADPKPTTHTPKTVVTVASSFKDIKESTSSSNDNSLVTFGCSSLEKVSQPGGNASAVAPLMTASSSLPITADHSSSIADDAVDSPCSQQPPTSTFSNTGCQSTSRQFLPSTNDHSNSQFWITPLVSASQGSSNATTLTSSQYVSKQNHNTSSAGVSESSSLDKNSCERKELPEYLFAAPCSSVPVPVQGSYAVQPHSMQHGMQYPPVVPHMYVIHQQSNSTNPFYLCNASTPIQNAMFPSVVSLQGALPHVSAQQQCYTSTIAPSTNMEQQIQGNQLPLGHQGVGGFGNEGTAFFMTGERVNGGNPFA